jgi:AcrR family transcriptional regulator
MTSVSGPAGSREAATRATRERILGAAHRFLAESGPDDRFSVEAVAKLAGVTRLTVYNQFGSRAGLLEALFDDLARDHLMRSLPAAFQSPSGRGQLDSVIRAYLDIWTAHRLVFRRLRAMAVLDREFGDVLERRDPGWRREVMKRAMSGLALPPADVESLGSAVFALTSFPFFDTLAGELGERAAAAEVERLVDAALSAAKAVPPR